LGREGTPGAFIVDSNWISQLWAKAALANNAMRENNVGDIDGRMYVQGKYVGCG